MARANSHVEKAASRRRATGQANDKLTAAVGIGLMVFIRAVDRSDPNPAYLVGPIPLFVGAALLAYTDFLAPKQP